jgi:hypothetical protein
MINLNNILKNLLIEDSSKTSIRSRIEYAIKNRIPLSFYYKGPSDEVLSGRRIKVEAVASGLTKKGNLAIRGYVQPPSTSKKGFREHGWRTFLVGRISPGSLTIYEDEQFNEKRPGYKEGNDSAFTVTYVTSDWGTVRKPEKEIPTPQPQVKEPEVKKREELPQPKPKDKPSITPSPEIKRDIEIFNNLKSKIKTIENQKQITPDELKTAIDDLYKLKLSDWKKSQEEIGGNLTPGEGTRRRLEKDSETDLYNLLKKDNIQVIKPNEPETQTNLQEELSRIKTLIFF